jgi:adenylylsulfate kinase
MTGINAPYEPPLNPDIEIVTEKMTTEESVKQIVEYIKNMITLKNE